MPPASSACLRTGLLMLIACLHSAAAVDRVVIIKVDGVPERLIERYAEESAGPGREGRSRLPWIQHVFGKNGTWLENFYVRGLSLSAPSWSLLDTGRHLEIRGNAEYDRYTLRVWDYLNFFPFYVGYALSRRVDMPGVELLDQHGVPLLIDRFPYPQRYQSFQLLQRGVRWTTLESSLRSKFTSRPLKDLFDEWQTGFAMSSSISEQMERELMRKLKDPRVRYLDYFSGEFDHVAHLTPDRVAQLHTLQSIDALVGRVWSAIASSPLPDTTALVVVSDHGMNTEEGVYSQGYNLVDWFTSAAGGAHHVITNRHPMTEFKLKGIDPFVSEVITPSQESAYLAGESGQYPTVVLDLDGNERASIGLRNNTLNLLQILLEQLTRKRLPGNVRRAAIDAFFEILGRERPAWTRNVAALEEELRALRARIEMQQKRAGAEPSQWTREQRDLGLDKDARRQANRLEAWKAEDRAYSDYASTISRLLALDPSDFDPGKFKIEEVIPRRSLGEPNSIHALQNYVVGPGPDGLLVAANGKLDMEKSFRTLDYFSAIGALSVRNNVQKAVSPHPVDFIAVPVKDGIWLRGSEDRQALVFTRHNAAGRLELRYMPVSHLKQDAAGELHYDCPDWSAGFPLELLEDPLLDVPPAERQAWLGEWHEELDWLRAVYRTKYSNGIIGLAEELLSDPAPSPYLERKRRLRRADLLVFASDHWNFNVRGFNPGGNHGSLLRLSTHSVLLISGGKDTGIPRGLRVATPYDSLSFVPTILALMGKPEPALPGPVIAELLATGH